jgi:16S rRNA (uracil1498-N3)-methyltransferase
MSHEPSEARLPRFHVPEAAPGARLELPEHSAHHAREVLRLRAGAAVRVFDGAGNEYEAELESVTRNSVSARLRGAVAARPESGLRLILALPPLKGDRMELVIQKATELGVTELWPVVTARSDAVGRPALTGARHDRWEKVASGAAEQCGRAVVPTVAPTRTLAGLLEAPFDGGRVLLHAAGEPRPLASMARPAGDSLLLLIGPAGGWETHELTRLEAAGFQTASLGPRILRAETAAIAAVGAAQLLWGDLSREVNP